jgi:hypothetical protein
LPRNPRASSTHPEGHTNCRTESESARSVCCSGSLSRSWPCGYATGPRWHKRCARTPGTRHKKVCEGTLTLRQAQGLELAYKRKHG